MTIKNFGVRNHIITFENENIRLVVTDLGATILNVFVKDKKGKERDVFLNLKDETSIMDEYEYNFGSTIGRYAGMIIDSKFTFQGKNYTLDQNRPNGTYNSGYALWSKRTFGIEKYSENEVTFELISKDGDQGFPGELDLQVTFTLLENGFEINFSMLSEADTIHNLTQMLSFNLNGEGSGSTKHHKIKLESKYYVPQVNHNEPFGIVAPTVTTPIDFYTDYRTLVEGKVLDTGMTKYYNGYPIYFVTDDKMGMEIVHKQAEIIGDKSGIKLTIESNYPCIALDFYENLSIAGKSNHIYNKNDGICFTPSYFPNAVNIKNFDQDILRKNREKVKTIRCLFSRD